MDIKTLLYEYHKINNFPLNYILAHNDTFAAFIPCGTENQSMFVVADSNYNPIFTYITNAYIFICSISDSGRYAACITASSKELHNDDGDSLFFFDIENKKLLWKEKLKTHCKYIKHLFIDELKHSILVRCNDFSYTYDFNGIVAFNEQQRIKSKTISPYQLNSEINTLIDTMAKNSNKDIALLSQIKQKLNIICNNEKMSSYQISLTLQKLGDLYLSFNDIDNALHYYRKGLEYNPKLPVKKLINNLEENKQ